MVSGSHNFGYDEFYPLRYNTAWSGESEPTFRRNISSPSSESTNKSNKKQVPCFTLVSSLVYSSTLKMEVICFFFFKTAVDFQRSSRHYIPEQRPLRFEMVLTMILYLGLLVSPLFCCSKENPRLQINGRRGKYSPGYLLNDTFCIVDNRDRVMNNELERIWKETVMGLKCLKKTEETLNRDSQLIGMYE
jgi:hypothetical protein